MRHARHHTPALEIYKLLCSKVASEAGVRSEKAVEFLLGYRRGQINTVNFHFFKLPFY